MAATAVLGGTALLGATMQSNAASNATEAQTAAANQANATQLQMYNTTRQDQAPWRQAGANALGALQQFYGLGGPQGGGQVQANPAQAANGLRGAGMIPGQSRTGLNIQAAPGQPQAAQGQSPYNFQSILQGLPGYQFQLQSGADAINRNLAARGLLQSGAAGKALTQYGQNVGQDYAQQYVGGLQSLAGIGMQSNQLSQLAGQNYANQVGNNLGYLGNAQASGYANQANAWQSGLAGLSSAYGNYRNSYVGSGQYGQDAASINAGVAGIQAPNIPIDYSIPGLGG